MPALKGRNDNYPAGKPTLSSRSRHLHKKGTVLLHMARWISKNSYVFQPSFEDFKCLLKIFTIFLNTLCSYLVSTTSKSMYKTKTPPNCKFLSVFQHCRALATCLAGMHEKQRERQRQRDRQTDRQTETDRERDRQTGRQR